MKKRMVSFKILWIIVWSVAGILNAQLNAIEQWTWSYKKIFDVTDKKKFADNELLFAREGVPPFTQLIFSWNAYRPAKGHFTFYAQVRDAITKKWYKVHKMVEWGEREQKSYASTCEHGVTYAHVRLEMPTGSQADGFRIKVKPDQHAELNKVRALNVTVSHFAKFAHEEVQNKIAQLPYVHVRGVPKQSQMVLLHDDNKSMCSPTSLSMVLGYLGKNSIDPVMIASKVYDHGLKAYGSWPFNTAHAFEHCGGNVFFHTTRLNSFVSLHTYLCQGTPVIVSIRGPISTGALDYRYGHLIVVVGWDPKKQVVLCHDPAFEDDLLVYHEYDIRDFMKAWERSHRLSYVAERRWRNTKKPISKNVTPKAV